jgi:OTU domain-containing protein 3
LTDPTSSTQLLTTQLQSLGLYAAPTIGDGNCLFRALSDQVHGSPEKHREVRRQVCDWIEQHKERYEGFVEDDDYLVEDAGGKAGKRSGDRDKGKGLEAHLRCMRENGKLSARSIALVLYPNLIMS